MAGAWRKRWRNRFNSDGWVFFLHPVIWFVAFMAFVTWFDGVNP